MNRITNTVTPARVRMFEPSRRPAGRQGEWLKTSWGECKVEGRLGQQHCDLFESILWTAEDRFDNPDGGIELLVDPYKIRQCFKSGASLARLKEWVKDLRKALVEIKTPKIHIIGGIIDHVVCIQSDRKNPFNGEDREIWVVRIGVAGAELIKKDHPLRYDPRLLISLKYGTNSAIARFLLSHSSGPALHQEGMKMRTVLRAVLGQERGLRARQARLRLRKERTEMAKIGIFFRNDRIWREKLSEPKTCSQSPAE